MPSAAVRAPTLEDLRQAQQPAWLWDGARGRIVWANQPGIAAFECQTLFDLIDRPFSLDEPGVQKISELSRRLNRDEREIVDLSFPSSGRTAAHTCHAYVHALADGRNGILAVATAPAIASAADASAALILDQLPLPFLLATADGILLKQNEASERLLGGGKSATLATLLGSAERAASLLSRLNEIGLVSTVEVIPHPEGPRDVRLIMNRLESADEARISILMEDITARRALERSLQQPPAPAATSKAEAFDALSKSLADKLRDVARPPEQDKPRQQAEPQKPVQPAPPFVPEFVRAQFEKTGEALFVRREGKPIFVTTAAVKLLEREDAQELLNDQVIWRDLSAVGAEGRVLSWGGERFYEATREDIPWHNGPAEKYRLKQVERPEISMPAETAKPAQPPVVDPEPRSAAQVIQFPATPAPDTRRTIFDANDLQAILDAASDGIIALDSNGNILSFNAAAESIFGWNANDISGKPLANLLQPDSRKILKDYLAGLSGPGLASVFSNGREVQALTRQGGSIPLFITISKLQYSQTQAEFCAVLRDITAWKRTEQQLRDAKERAEIANRQKSEFLARVSHELRTPLNAILGFSDVMRTERFGELRNDKYKAYANDIHSSGSHVLALINDLLDLSRIEAGKLELNFTSVSLEDATEYAVRSLTEQARAAGVLVRQAFPKKLPRVVADHKTIRQIVMNLLSNAIKYTDAGGQVLIAAQTLDDGSLVYRVKDTGIGMTAQQMQEALKPFARVETPNRERQGTGLGLPLTKALVEANRASFTLTSEPGKGTLAEIKFPSPRVLAE